MKVTSSTLHVLWLYDLHIDATDDFKVQYEEIPIDVENPPIYSFSDGPCTIEDTMELFDLILEVMKEDTKRDLRKNG